MKTFKLCRQMLACVLVFAMILGTCATAFAVVPGGSGAGGHGSGSAAAKPIKYVSLGDSMTNGYGLEGYDGNSGVEDYGYGSYANLFAQRIHAVDHKQLAMSAMRAEDLHWLLELDYKNDPHLWEEDWKEDAWNNAFSTGDYWTWDEICTHSRTDATIAAIAATGYEADGVEDVARYYREAVKDADIISLGMGNGNFGVFAFGRIMEAIGFGGTPDEAMIYNVERALAECDPEMQAKILGLKDTLVAKVAPLRATVGAAFNDEQWEALFNTAVYTGLSYVLNYAGSVEAILQLNPDAEIILVALMNTFAEPGTVVDYTNISTIGDIMGAIFEPLNMFIAGLPAVMQAAGNGVYKDAKFYYAEAPEVDCLVNTYADGIDGTIRDRFVESIVGVCEHNTYHSSPVGCDDAGMVWGLLAPMVPGLVDGAELKWISLADIAAYEAMDAADKAVYAATDMNKAISCALYLAFEDAIINAADATVDLASVMNLGDLSGAIFGGVMAEFNANIGAAGAAYVPELVAVEPFASNLAGIFAALHTSGDVAEVLACSDPAHAAYCGAFKEGISSACMLLALPETLSAALANDTNINGLLGLFARCIIGNGIGAHPSARGHEALADAIYKAYEEGYTAKDETINNVITIINEYYDEAYAYAYAAADKEGYVDAAAAAIDKAIAAIEDVKARDFEDDEMTAEFEAILDAELDAVVATLNEAKAVLESEAAADVEGLEASVAELWDDLLIHLTGAGALLDQAGVDIETLVVPVVDAYVSTLIAKANDALTEIKEYIAGIDAENVDIKEKIAEIKAWVEENKDDLPAKVKAAIDEYIAELEAKANDCVDELKAEAAKLIAMAGHKHYEAAEGSKYVAIGGDTVIGSAIAYPGVPYYALVGEHYEIDSQAVTAAGLAPEAALALVEANSAAIEAADLVTYQLDASFLVTALLGGEADWDKYIDAETKALVDEVLAQTKEVVETNWAEYAGAKLEEIIPEIKAAVVASLPEEVDFDEEVFAAAADFVVPYLMNAAAFVESKKAEAVEAIEAIDQAAIDYAEKVAYAIVSYAIETKAVVEKIQEINPDATLVVVGMYNPVRGLELVVGEETIDAEEIFEYVIDATNLYYAALAVENKGFAFADVSDAETNGFNISLNVTGMEMDEIIANVAGLAMGGLDKVMHANADGHEYIKEQIVKALTCDYGACEPLDAESHAVECSICGYAKVDDHDLSYEKLNKTNHTVKCDICGYEATEAHDFDGNTCTLCGYVKSNGGFGGGGAVSTGKFVVKFETNGGSTIASVSVKKGEVVAEPAAPTKEGFVFDGWYTDKALTAKYDFSTPVTKSFTLYAKWAEVSAADKFADLDKAAWYYEYVKAIIEKGFMNGVSETGFAPDATLTRGMFVTILHRVEGEVAAENAVAFADVAEGQWYTNAVKWASANGIVKGITETEFAPDAKVTREQMAAMIARYADYKKLEIVAEGDVTYTDSDEISEYAKDAVKTANKLGILIGNADGSFAPKKDATRAEAAALFVRLLGVLEK